MNPLPLKTHAPAPAFHLAGPDGTTVSLRDYRFQKDLMIVALHGPGCPHCAKVAAELVEQRKLWDDWGTSLLVVQGEAEPFDTPFRLALDPNADLKLDYTGSSKADAFIAILEHRGRLMDGWVIEHPKPVDWQQVGVSVRWVAVQEPECGACEVLPGWGDD